MLVEEFLPPNLSSLFGLFGAKSDQQTAGSKGGPQLICSLLSGQKQEVS